MKSLGMSQSVQDGIKAAVDELHLKVANLEAESLAYKTVYEDTEKEVKVNLERRIQQVKDDVKI